MKVVISTIGKFHSFDLARQLEERDALAGIFTGYPMFKLRDERLPREKIHSWPYFQTPYMSLVRFTSPNNPIMRQLGWMAWESLDRHVSRNLPACDAFIGLSVSGLRTAQVVKSQGGVYVCDRGSAHISFQNEILIEEYRHYGIAFKGIDPRVIAKEEAEYALADAIFVPSEFAANTHLQRGIPESKLAYAPYGVDLVRFSPVAEPDPEFFDVLFVGNICVRKGIRHLIAAFKNISHPNKRLTLVGSMEAEVRQYVELAVHNLPIRVTGIIPQTALKNHLSRAHVLVLPSVEDGYGLVMSEAMACGCPVVASDHTGGPDLITHDIEGYIFKSGDVQELTHYLQIIADDPGLRARLSGSALKRVQSDGGWENYGEAVFGKLARLVTERGRK